MSPSLTMKYWALQVYKQLTDARACSDIWNNTISFTPPRYSKTRRSPSRWPNSIDPRISEVVSSSLLPHSIIFLFVHISQCL